MHQAEKFRKMLYYWRNLTFIGFFHLSSQFFFQGPDFVAFVFILKGGYGIPKYIYLI